jgi:endonuclease/exonuclease/phosphatase family metal-dependent hydrolase
MRALTWNLGDYMAPGASLDAVARCREVPEVVEAARPDVVILQGIMCDAAGFERLAFQLGMRCRVTAGRASRMALDPGRHGRGLGIMWKPEAVPVSSSLMTFERSILYTGMVVVELVIDGVPVVYASTHLAPRGLNLRYDEATTIASVLYGFKKHVLIGADWNCISGVRRPDGEYYDQDPYETRPWDPAFITQCRRDAGAGWHWADREPMNAMESGGLHDVAAMIDAPWRRTTGHWTSESLVKRSSGFRGTLQLAKATTTVRSIDTTITCRISPHLPVVAEVDLCQLAQEQAA